MNFTTWQNKDLEDPEFCRAVFLNLHEVLQTFPKFKTLEKVPETLPRLREFKAFSRKKTWNIPNFAGTVFLSHHWVTQTFPKFETLEKVLKTQSSPK